MNITDIKSNTLDITRQCKKKKIRTKCKYNIHGYIEIVKIKIHTVFKNCKTE